MGQPAHAAIKRIAAAAAGVALAALLSACGSTADVSRLVIAPGKYDIYTCRQIADQMQVTETEGRRLEGLMARASQGAGGAFINDIAYEPEYVANRGEARELRASAASKHCPSVPAEAAPGDRSSEKAIQ